MHSENKKQFLPKQQFRHRDDRLLLLQKSITSKISKTKDDTLIKFYLYQVHKISQQRLALLKREDNASRYSEVSEEQQPLKLLSEAV